MPDAGLIVRHYEEARTKRLPYEWIWKDSYAYTYPVRGAQLWTSGQAGDLGDAGGLAASATRQADLLDTTGTDSVRILASALMSGLTPANSRWFGLEVNDADDAAKRWLDEAAEKLWTYIHRSNYDAVGYESMLDLVCSGQCPLYIDEAPTGGLRFEQWPLAQCYYSSSTRAGPVDTVYRCMTMTAQQAVDYYGADKVGSRTLAAASAQPLAPQTYLWAIYPRDGGYRGDGTRTPATRMPYASCHLDMVTKSIVRESGYEEMPVIVPRWLLLSDAAYAIGPVFEALPDLRQLNHTIRLQNQGMEIHAGAGTYKATDDGVLNPRTIKLGHRRVIVVGNIDNLVPLAEAGDMQKTLLDIERLQRAIRKVLMADQLQPQDGPQMTATEVHVRTDLIRQQLGPLYGRMQAEFLQPMVERCFGLAFRAGALPPPPQSLAGQSYRIQYLSPLARAQKLVDVSAMDRFELSLQAEAAVDPTVLDHYDLDEAARTRGDLLGVPKRLIREQAIVDEIRKARAKAQQAQQAEQMAMMSAQASDSDQPDTATTAMMGAITRRRGAAA